MMTDQPVADLDHSDILALCDLVEQYRNEIANATEDLSTLASELASANGLIEVQKEQLSTSNLLVSDLEDSICVLDDELVELRDVVETVTTLLSVQAPAIDLLKGLRSVLNIEHIDQITDTEPMNNLAVNLSTDERNAVIAYKTIIAEQLIEISCLKGKIKILEMKEHSESEDFSRCGSPVKERVRVLEEENLKNNQIYRNPSDENLLRQQRQKTEPSSYLSRNVSGNVSPSANSVSDSLNRSGNNVPIIALNFPEEKSFSDILMTDCKKKTESEKRKTESESDDDSEDDDGDRNVTISLPYRRASTDTSVTHHMPTCPISPNTRLKYDGALRSRRSSNSEIFGKPITTPESEYSDTRMQEKRILKELERLREDEIEKDMEGDREEEVRRKDRMRRKENDREIEEEKMKEIEREKVKEKEIRRERERESENKRKDNEVARAREKDREREKERDRDGRENEWRREADHTECKEEIYSYENSANVPGNVRRKGSRGSSAISEALKRVRINVNNKVGLATSNHGNNNENYHNIHTTRNNNNHDKKGSYCSIDGDMNRNSWYDEDRDPQIPDGKNKYSECKNLDENDVRVKEQQNLHQKWLETSFNSPEKKERKETPTPTPPSSGSSNRSFRPLNFSHPVLRSDCGSDFFDREDLRHSDSKNHTYNSEYFETNDSEINKIVNYSMNKKNNFSGYSSYRNNKVDFED